jgi:hypothetical protein
VGNRNRERLELESIELPVIAVGIIHNKINSSME